MKKEPTRLVFIDFVRSVAVLIALLSHIFIFADTYSQLGENAIYVRRFTRFATPLFIFMFGFMIEFVFLRRIDKIGRNAVTKRLFLRSAQCYAAFTLCSIAAIMGGYQTFPEFLQTLILQRKLSFGSILLLYSILLLLSPFILRLRLYLGRYLSLICISALIISYNYLDRFQSIDFGFYNIYANKFLGIGTILQGPSVWGALSIYMAGMFIASFIPNNISLNSISFKEFYKGILILSSVLIILAVLFLDINLFEAFDYFAVYECRALNTPEYYIIGILGSMSILALASLIIGIKELNKRISFVLVFGTSSLVSFTSGNMLLYVSNRFLDKPINFYFFIPLFYISVYGVTILHQKIVLQHIQFLRKK